MNILVDTGVLLRVVIRADPLHPQAREAVRTLRARGDKLIALTQNAAEFWNVCTRPSSAKGGYGLSIQDAAKKLRLIERLVEFKPDSLAAFQEWKRLVVAHWRLKRMAKGQNKKVCFLSDLQVVPSCRRFGLWPLWKTLVWTNPIVILPLRRRREAWRGWYRVPPR